MGNGHQAKQDTRRGEKVSATIDLTGYHFYRFYKKKLESFFKSQYFVDEQIFKQESLKNAPGLPQDNKDVKASVNGSNGTNGQSIKGPMPQ